MLGIIPMKLFIKENTKSLVLAMWAMKSLNNSANNLSRFDIIIPKIDIIRYFIWTRQLLWFWQTHHISSAINFCRGGKPCPLKYKQIPSEWTCVESWMTYLTSVWTCIPKQSLFLSFCNKLLRLVLKNNCWEIQFCTDILLHYFCILKAITINKSQKSK